MMRMRAHAGSAGRYILWKDAEAEPKLQKQIKWPPIKLHRRAIEKLIRSYDVSAPRTLHAYKITLHSLRHTPRCVFTRICIHASDLAPNCANDSASNPNVCMREM